MIGIDNKQEWECSLEREGKKVLVCGKEKWETNLSFREIMIKTKEYLASLEEKS